VLLGLSEAITVAEIRGFIIAVSTCVTIFSFSATYLIAGKIKYQSEFQWWQPFRGGIRFVLLQAAAWMFFSVSLLLPLSPFVAAVVYPRTAVVGFSLCGGASALLGQVAMMCSLPLFSHVHVSHPDATPKRPTSPQAEWFADEQWWGWFIAVQVFVACAGFLLSVISESVGKGVSTDDDPSWVLGLFALFCVVLSTTLTHGIGGRWMHRRSHWCFFQPGEGGARFVALQGLSWTCFSLSVYVLIIPPLAVCPSVCVRAYYTPSGCMSLCLCTCLLYVLWLYVPMSVYVRTLVSQALRLCACDFRLQPLHKP
jgi:hypothetical protein